MQRLKMAFYNLCVALFIHMCLLSDMQTPAFAAARSTIIQNLQESVVQESSNITLTCNVGRETSGINTPNYACARIRFTKNQTIFAEDSRHRPSSTPNVDSEAFSNSIPCHMTILRLQSEDSGEYGCCWPDANTRRCQLHPTIDLTVIPTTTTDATPTVRSTATVPANKTDLSTEGDGEHEIETNNVAYNTISPEKTQSKENGTITGNEAFRQGSLHKTVWPLLLVIVFTGIIIFVVVTKYMKKQRTKDADSIPDIDPESPEYYPGVQENGISLPTDGLITTTTTTTTIITHQDQSDDTQR